MMIGNQYKWEETIASKVGDQASARLVSSEKWVWHRATTQIVEVLIWIDKCIYLVIAECSNSIHVMVS